MTLIAAPGAALAATLAAALEAAVAGAALEAPVAGAALDAAVAAGALDAAAVAAAELGALDDLLLLLQAATSIAAEIPHRTSFPVR